MFLSDEGPTLETLDFTFHIGSTTTFLNFDLYLNTAYISIQFSKFYLSFYIFSGYTLLSTHVQPIPVLLFWFCILACQKIDLAFLLDSWPNVDKTDSVKGESVKGLIRYICGSFSVGKNGLRVGLLKAGFSASVEFDFNANKDFDSLDEAVDDVTFPENPSRLGQALDLANYGLFRNSGRPDAVKILLVVAQNKSSDDVSSSARNLRKSGVSILSVRIGQGVYGDDLESIVSPPKQYNALFGDFSSLEKLGPDIVKRIHNSKCNKEILHNQYEIFSTPSAWWPLSLS